MNLELYNVEDNIGTRIEMVEEAQLGDGLLPVAVQLVAVRSAGACIASLEDSMLNQGLHWVDFRT